MRNRICNKIKRLLEKPTRGDPLFSRGKTGTNDLLYGHLFALPPITWRHQRDPEQVIFYGTVEYVQTNGWEVP